MQGHALADRTRNRVLVGSADIQIVDGTMQVRNTSTSVKVTNQAMQIDRLEAARRLESTDTTDKTEHHFTIAKTEVDEVALLFRSGVSTFVTAVPSTSDEPEFWTVQVEHPIPGHLAGSAGGNSHKWSLDCEWGSDTCKVTTANVLEGALTGAPDPSLLAADPSRRLMGWRGHCKKRNENGRC